MLTDNDLLNIEGFARQSFAHPLDTLKLVGEVGRLREAVRKHMNARGDDRCFQDDHELYQVLPEGDTRPEKDTAVTLENCER